MGALLQRTLRDNRVVIAIYSLSSLIIAWMYVAMFPSIAKESEAILAAVQNYPQGFMEAFGIDINKLSFTDIHAFLSMEHFSMIWPIIAITFALSLASNALAGEIERGTIVYLLSHPVSRTQVFGAKFFSAILTLVFFSLVSILGIIPLVEIHNVAYTPKNFVLFTLLGSAFSLAVYGIGILLSSTFSEKSKAVFLSSGIIILMYVLNIAASLKDSLDKLKYLSFFYYYDQSAAFVDGTISTRNIVVFLSVFIVSSIAALTIFNKRDLAA